MAFPQGSGSERIKRFKANLTSGSDSIIHNGVSLHIYTFLSIIICNTLTAAATFGIHIEKDGSASSADLYYLIGGSANNHPLGGQETFVFNDKFMLEGADHLVMNGPGSSNIDVWYTFIDQDWT